MTPDVDTRGPIADFPAFHLIKQRFDKLIVDVGAEFLGWLGDGHPQLPVGHRGHQVPVLDGFLQYRIFGAASLKIGPDTQDHQTCGGFPNGVL